MCKEAIWKKRTFSLQAQRKNNLKSFYQSMRLLTSWAFGFCFCFFVIQTHKIIWELTNVNWVSEIKKSHKLFSEFKPKSHTSPNHSAPNHSAPPNRSGPRRSPHCTSLTILTGNLSQHDSNCFQLIPEILPVCNFKIAIFFITAILQLFNSDYITKTDKRNSAELTTDLVS